MTEGIDFVGRHSVKESVEVGRGCLGRVGGGHIGIVRGQSFVAVGGQDGGRDDARVDTRRGSADLAACPRASTTAFERVGLHMPPNSYKVRW